MSYRIVLFGTSETRKRVQGKIERLFRRRSLSDALDGEGRRHVVLRNGADLTCIEKEQSGFFGEPILEMLVRSNDEYVRRSAEALEFYARRNCLRLGISIERLNDLK